MTQRKMKTRQLTKTEKLMMTKVVTQYVYLLQTREFLNSKEPVYKIGRSKQDNYARFSQYGLGSVLLFQSSCDDSIKLEKEIIGLFNQKYERIKILGNEWFRGNANEMKADLCDIIKNSTVTGTDAFVEDVVVEEWIHQYFTEENIQDVFDGENIQDVFDGENIQDVFDGENIQDVFVEETIQEIIQDDFVENGDYGRVMLDDEVVVVEDEEVVDDRTQEDIENKSIQENETIQANIEKKIKGRFYCEICKYPATTNGHLKQHQMTKKHLDIVNNVEAPIYPFSCIKCDKGYVSKSGLRKHKLLCRVIKTVSPAISITPEVVNVDLHTKIDNLERVIEKLTSLVENKLI